MIGFTSVTFRNKIADEIIELAVKAEAQCIEWGGDVHVTDPDTAAAVAEKCAAAGIAVNSFGSYYKAGVSEPDSFERDCETAKALGAKIIRIWAGAAGSLFTPEKKLAELVADTRRIEDIAAAYSLVPAFEFHPNTFFDKGSTALSFLNSTKGIVKSYWQPAYRGADIKNLKSILPAAVNIHMFYWDKFGTNRCLLSQGEERIREFADIIKNSSFSGDVLLEFVKDDSESSFLADMKLLKDIFTA